MTDRSGVVAGVAWKLTDSNLPSLHLTVAEGASVLLENVVMTALTGGRLVRSRDEGFADGAGHFMLRVHGPAGIVANRDGCGVVTPIELGPGEPVHVRGHRVVASVGVRREAERVYAPTDSTGGDNTFLLEHYTAGPQGGIVWVHAHGDVHVAAVTAQTPMLLEPGMWTWLRGDVEVTTRGVRVEGDDPVQTPTPVIMEELSGSGQVGVQLSRH